MKKSRPKTSNIKLILSSLLVVVVVGVVVLVISNVMTSNERVDFINEKVSLLKDEFVSSGLTGVEMFDRCEKDENIKYSQKSVCGIGLEYKQDGQDGGDNFDKLLGVLRTQDIFLMNDLDNNLDESSDRKSTNSHATTKDIGINCNVLLSYGHATTPANLYMILWCEK